MHGARGGRHVLRLGQRFQPVRGVAVLEPDVGPVAQRPGQAAVWLHRRGRQCRRLRRTADHAGPGAAGGAQQPADRLGPAAGGVDRGRADAAAAVCRCRRGPGRGGTGRAARPARWRARRVALALPVQDRLVDPDRQFRRHVLLSGAGPHRRRDAQRPDRARGAVRPRRPGGERADDPGAGVPGRAHHADVRRRRIRGGAAGLGRARA